MRLSPLNYRSLFILYGLSVLSLMPFGGFYAYATIHGWNRNHVLLICLISGVSVALMLWSLLEPGLLAAQSVRVAKPVNRYVFNASSSVVETCSTWGVAQMRIASSAAPTASSFSGQVATAGKVHYAG
jgi:hypothetical protein